MIKTGTGIVVVFFCNNSWTTKDQNGAKLKHYKLSEVAKDKGLKAAYDKILKNKKVSV